MRDSVTAATEVAVVNPGTTGEHEHRRRPALLSTSFLPQTTGECANTLGAPGTAPQTCVDWCDAKAYCLAQGKRLCGPIGNSQLGPGDLFKYQFNSWYAACSADDTRSHPYGAFVAGKCNDVTANVGMIAGTPFKSGSCVGGLPSLHDMSGNAAEWIDSCSQYAGPNDQCFVMGGSYKDSDSTKLSCKGSASSSRNNASMAHIGFRCCT